MNPRIVLAGAVFVLAAGCDPPPAPEGPAPRKGPPPPERQVFESEPAPAPDAVASSSKGTIGLGNLATIGHGEDGTFSKCRVRPGPYEVSGAISKENVHRFIRAHINEVRFCYQQGLEVEPDLGGNVWVRFGIDATGAVVDPQVAKSTHGSEDVDACIVKAFNLWTFPEPEDGKAVSVKMRYVLEPPVEE